MKYEVEQKFPAGNLAGLQQKLKELGGELGEAVVQVDRYYAHPNRDFSKTDEALRIRQVGDRNWITYKGPKIDSTTKTRREIELALAMGEAEAESWQEMLEALGFTAVAVVRKQRRKCRIAWQQADVEMCLDQVDQLGDFVELELVAEANSLDAARDRILSLAECFGLSGAERRSYLELLLSKQEPRAC